MGRRRLDLAPPVQRNDAITTEAWLKDLVEHGTTFAGRSVQQVYHVHFFNERGELVAEADSWCFRTDRDIAREEGTKYTEVKGSRRALHRRGAGRVYRLYAEEQVARRDAALLGGRGGG